MHTLSADNLQMLHFVLGLLLGSVAVLGGALWPQPKASIVSTTQVVGIDANAFSFIAGGVSSPTLLRAFARYKTLAFQPIQPVSSPVGVSPCGTLSCLNTTVLSSDITLQIGVDESVRGAADMRRWVGKLHHNFAG